MSPAAQGAEDDPEVVVEFVRLLRLCDKLQVHTARNSVCVAESRHDHPVPACAACLSVTMRQQMLLLCPLQTPS